MQPPLGMIAGDQSIQPRLVDRQLPFFKPLDFFLVDINTIYLVPHFGKTGAADQTDIAGADNC